MRKKAVVQNRTYSHLSVVQKAIDHSCTLSLPQPIARHSPQNLLICWNLSDLSKQPSKSRLRKMQSLQKLIPWASDELRGEFKVGPLGKQNPWGALLFVGGDVLNTCSLWKKNYCMFNKNDLLKLLKLQLYFQGLKHGLSEKDEKSRRVQDPNIVSTSLPYQAPLQDFPAMLEKRSLWIYVRVFWFMIECWKTRVN